MSNAKDIPFNHYIYIYKKADILIVKSVTNLNLLNSQWKWRSVEAQ